MVTVNTLKAAAHGKISKGAYQSKVQSPNKSYYPNNGYLWVTDEIKKKKKLS